jgi:sialic acid synthase SpsE
MKLAFIISPRLMILKQSIISTLCPAHKIGSGDVNWIEELEHIARKGKPILLATGASDIGDVQRAVHAVRKINRSWY